MKKIFTLFAALAMVMSMSAVDMKGGEVLYLTPNANWKMGDARFAIYVYGNGEAWASMTAVEGETDLYKAVVPTGNWTNVIFCRMNPGTTTNNWTNKWDQTNDLSYDGTNNHYTVKEGTWNKGGGTWSKYVTTVTITIQADNGTVTGLATDGEYEGGTQATLTAVPNDGYEFVNWTVGGKEVSTANPYTFTVSDNITLVANFKEAAAKSYTIKTSATNGTAEGAATVVEGESVTLTATANLGYKFVNWTVGGVEVSTDNPYTFVPTEDATVVANFEQLPPETVYFVNAADWTGTINIHAWGGTASGTAWPGNPATKEDYQIGGHDVYSLTAAAGAYAYVIFNNKIADKDGGSQTDDLEWTAGKYYVLDDWYTKEEAEEKLASGDPLGLTYNVTVPAGTNACYIAGDMNGWSQQEMTKVDDTHYTITIVDATTANKYKYCSGPEWAYEELNEDGTSVQDRTYSENDVVAKWKEVYTPGTPGTPDTPATYYVTGNEALLGAAAAWNPDAIAMTEVEGVYTHTFTAVAAGVECQLKVTEGDWDNGIWGYDNLSNTPDGVTTNDDRNIIFTLAEAGDVVVTFDGEKITVEGNFAVSEPEPVVMTTIYLNTGGSALWNNEGAKFFAHSWKDGVGNEQDKELTLVEGDLYKLDIPEDHDMIIFLRLAPGATGVVWGGDKYWNQTENLTIPSDQNCYTITEWGADFNPVCKGTWSSYTYEDGNALDNVNTTVAPVKAIVNGQLVIIRDGVKYNVQGAVVK
ncbi:MAG: starch-binding protein [Paludibacteraceae bacterium]|nr:starch-binding protein [Paludibacteraceae bacterium]